MGQRFTLDAAVMQQLVFNKVRGKRTGRTADAAGCVGYAGGARL